ncbi:hypothetical protein BIV57_08085 [Mangrovactinospora gilvigrisea]|uniref:Uncharacterized protein n=1 Tax=Mangrovactinospora gilvigrisea TaxID=1428644 RepID=A0A1J7BWY6_9ACTN|nr:ParA family protein [Mangrovactinospora gilvigrisea]OIV37985.1 hypothetical protein BIV57_08085 [Mangrovactinospora gilvigrisea]
MATTPPQARIIVFANPKGGAAKSTSAIHTAWNLAERGRVLLIDTDQQQDAYGWYASVVDPEQPDQVPFHVHRQADDKVYQAEIKKFRQEYDFIVVDTPGKADRIVTRAVFTADDVVVTTVPAGTELKNLPDALALIEQVNELREQIEQPPARPHVLLVRMDVRTNVGTKARERLAEMRLSAMRATIPHRVEILDGYGRVPRRDYYAPFVEELLGGADVPQGGQAAPAAPAAAV